MQAHDIGSGTERVEIGLGLVAVGPCALDRAGATPGEHAHPERNAVPRHERADRPVADDAERLAVELPADCRLPTPARSADASSTTQRADARISANVSSAGAYADPPPVHTAMPRRVQASTSTWGIPRPVWQMTRRPGRRASSGSSIGVRSRMRTSASAAADLFGPLLEVIRPFRVDDDVMPREEREAFEPLDGPLVVLHHDDAHGWTLASLAARSASRRAASDPGIPHGCYDSA